MATGDLEGNLERLRVQLRTIGYPHPLDMKGLREGSPPSVLPLLHYALLGYSHHVSSYLSETGYAMFAKSDLRFVECMLKYLRGEHAYRCPLTVAQILSPGYAERKFLFVYDVIQVCKRKHNELVRQARQAQQARKSLKRNATLSDIVKNIDAANLESLHMDETLSMALENMENQGCANAKDSNAFKPERKANNKLGYEDVRQQTQNQDPVNDRVQSYPEEVKTQENIGCQIDALQSSLGSSESACTNGSQDVDKLLNQCYEMLRGQIVEVAERMERHLLTLKGDVQRLTSDMQTRLSCLERQALHLEQILPFKNIKGQQTLSSFTGKSYERNLPFQPLNPIAVLCRVKDNDSIQQKLIGGLSNHHEQINTENLIATVKARCNQTKELLMDNQQRGVFT